LILTCWLLRLRLECLRFQIPTVSLIRLPTPFLAAIRRVDAQALASTCCDGYRRRSYAIKKAEELFPNAELVIDES